MKRFKSNIRLQAVSLIGALMVCVPFVVNSQSSKEVDDLYFSKNDRVKIKYATNEEGEQVTESQATYESYTNSNYNPSYSAKTVNPEYIAKYKSASRESVQEQLDEQSQLDAEENPNYSSEDYYVDGYDSQGYSTSGASTVNIYYGGGWNMWNPYTSFYYNSWNSPFWNPGWGISIGYSWGWGGFGWNRWNSYPLAFYDPWYGGWGGYYGYGWGWNRPYYGYYGNNWAYYNGFYDGYYSGKGSVAYRRNVVRGGRVNRSAAVGVAGVGTPGSSRYRNSNVANVTGSADRSGSSRGRTVSNSTSSRDYSSTQNEYFQRSRVGYSSGVGTSDRNTKAVTSRNSGREAYESTVRSRNTYSSPERSVSTGSRSTGTSSPSYNRGVDQNNSRNLNPANPARSGSSSEFRGATPGNSRVYQGQPNRQVAPPGSSYRTRSSSPSYSQPSNRGSYSSPSYNRSGSGSGSSGFSTPSRSSGASRSFSAPSPSRSSGSSFSAPSRSSGSSFSAPSRSSSGGSSGGRSSGSSSSGGSRRGGN